MLGAETLLSLAMREMLRWVPMPKSDCPPTQHLRQAQTPASAFFEIGLLVARDRDQRPALLAQFIEQGDVTLETQTLRYIGRANQVKRAPCALLEDDNDGRGQDGRALKGGCRQRKVHRVASEAPVS